MVTGPDVVGVVVGVAVVVGGVVVVVGGVVVVVGVAAVESGEDAVTSAESSPPPQAVPTSTSAKRTIRRRKTSPLVVEHRSASLPEADSVDARLRSTRP